MDWWLAYLAIGAGAGFLAGLLGIGGGMVIVPGLVFVYTAKGFPEPHLMHLALATALTTIVFTSASSVRAHHRYGAVDWPVARAMVPGMMFGAFCAAFAAGYIASRPLAILFTVFLVYAATQMLIDVKPRAARQLPQPAGLFGVGAVIGGLSSVLAVGGAFLSIPFLAWCNVPLKRAIGTAAANGFPIALAGSIGYVMQGLRIEDLPSGSFGYLYLPAFAFIVVASMLTAPLGARLTHRLPIRKLRAVFALMLYAFALRMAFVIA
ncbi:MAG TPA: sulfite exporter TauE/SafE family protein [Burkholderiales bacterium]|nr:sulfite exporter TauE/SafE family protein [Burkholderiales bacterium]